MSAITLKSFFLGLSAVEVLSPTSHLCKFAVWTSTASKVTVISQDHTVEYTC